MGLSADQIIYHCTRGGYYSVLGEDGTMMCFSVDEFSVGATDGR
jgi:hypothetical protein